MFNESSFDRADYNLRVLQSHKNVTNGKFASASRCDRLSPDVISICPPALAHKRV